jgi:hypothetical protein
MTYTNQSGQAGRDSAWREPDAANDGYEHERGAAVERLRARAARCNSLASQATSPGVATELEMLAREYEADAATLETTPSRR